MRYGQKSKQPTVVWHLIRSNDDIKLTYNAKRPQGKGRGTCMSNSLAYRLLLIGI